PHGRTQAGQGHAGRASRPHPPPGGGLAGRRGRDPGGAIARNRRLPDRPALRPLQRLPRPEAMMANRLLERVKARQAQGDGQGQGPQAAPAYPGDPEPWEAPVPFTEFPRPAFPVECLPRFCGNYVTALAEATQTPPDMGAMLILAVLGASL